MAQRSLAKRLWYIVLQFYCRTLGLVFFRVRYLGTKHIPKRGAMLVLSNHQSNLDPVLIGMAARRRLNYLARQTLFRFAPFRWLINSLDAIPIDRDGLGLAGLKECLRRLKHEEAVLLFPEGTRTKTGEVGPLKPGFCALAKRGDVWLLPVAIDGAFEAWPRSARLPRLTRIVVCIGAPLHNSEIKDISDDELVALVADRMKQCHAAARQERRRLAKS